MKYYLAENTTEHEMSEEEYEKFREEILKFNVIANKSGWDLHYTTTSNEEKIFKNITGLSFGSANCIIVYTKGGEIVEISAQEFTLLKDKEIT